MAILFWEIGRLVIGLLFSKYKVTIRGVKCRLLTSIIYYSISKRDVFLLFSADILSIILSIWRDDINENVWLSRLCSQWPAIMSVMTLFSILSAIQCVCRRMSMTYDTIYSANDWLFNRWNERSDWYRLSAEVTTNAVEAYYYYWYLYSIPLTVLTDDSVRVNLDDSDGILIRWLVCYWHWYMFGILTSGNCSLIWNDING
jgi:hypothetical protein